MDNVLDQLRELASSRSGLVRQQLMATLHDLAYSLEDDNDVVHRFGYLHLQTAAIKTGFDLGLFKLLSHSEKPLDKQYIAELVGANGALMARYLRYFSAIGVIKQVSPDEYAANHTTKLLTERVAESGISHCFETCGPEFQSLPAFLKSTAFKNPDDEMKTVFQYTHNTTERQFDWFDHHPDKLAYFNDFMATRRKPAVSWLSVYPVEEETKSLSDPSRALYVNMGGGVGHQCAEFKASFPHVPGRVILQDLPHTIETALQTQGVENMAHDFFTPQPVKGAKFYFTRGVCHNHPDKKVVELLKRIRDVMAADSVLLLDEFVLPPVGVNAYAAAIDLTMMAAFASGERDEAQWSELLTQAGLKLVKTYTYNPLEYESVMDVRLP